MDQKESYCYLILNIYWCHLLNEMSRSLVMTHVVNIWLANSMELQYFAPATNPLKNILFIIAAS